MNILNITSSFPLYDGHGAGPFVLEEARELANLGYQQTILTQHYKGSSYHEFIGPIEVRRFGWIEPGGYTRIREMTDLFHSPHLGSYFGSAIRHGLALTREKKFDVVYAQWALPSGLVGSIVSKVRGLPMVVVVHGADVLGSKPKKFPFNNINHWVFKNATQILARGEYLYGQINETYGRKFEDKLMDIPIGLNFDRYASYAVDNEEVMKTKDSIGANGRPIVLTIRNLSPNYELENLLRTIRMFRTVSHGIRPLFVVIGGGTPQYKAKLEKLAEDLDIQQELLLLGPVEHKDMEKYIAACDVFVDPAVIGQGVACLEAMSLGKPAVGFHKKGSAVKIVDGKDGFLVELSSPPEMSWIDMASKIRMLLEDRELRQELGQGAASTVRQRYQLKVTAKAVADVFERVAGKRLNVPLSQVHV